MQSHDLNNGPINVRTSLYHSNTKLVWYSDPRCIVKIECTTQVNVFHIQLIFCLILYLITFYFFRMPELDIPSIQEALRRGADLSGSTVPPILNKVSTSELPPTFNRTDKYTSGFQVNKFTFVNIS